MVLSGTDEPVLDGGGLSTLGDVEKQKESSIEGHRVERDNYDSSIVSAVVQVPDIAATTALDPPDAVDNAVPGLEPEESASHDSRLEQYAPSEGDVGPTEQAPPTSEPLRSALVSKVLQKAREAAQSDQRSTGATAISKISSGAASQLSDQRSTGATRVATGATDFQSRSQDQKNTGATKFTDQRSTGSTRFNDQRTTGATGMSNQRSTGSTPYYDDVSSTGTFRSRSLIGRPSPEVADTGENSKTESEEKAPERGRKSLTATIETEAKKSKRNLLEKIISRHPIIFGSVAFCVFVLPIYVYVVNSQSPDDRVAYKQSWGKDVKILSKKLGQAGEYKGHRATFYSNRADVYMKSGQYVSAIADLKIACELDAGNGDEYNLKLSTCYLQVKDFKKAVEAASNALKSDPDDIGALLRHAQASYLLGNKLTALDDYFKALKLDPSNPEVFIERGDYYMAEKKPSSAAADFKHALDLSPDLAEAKHKLAVCTAIAPVRHSEASESAKELSPAALKSITESDFNTLSHKGYEALRKGDNLFAIAALSRAVALNPNSALVRQYLAHAFLANGQYADAIAQSNAWDKIAKLNVQEKLAFVGRFPEGNHAARDFYDQLIDQHASDCAALIAIANAAKAHGFYPSFELAIQAGIRVGSLDQIVELHRLRRTREKDLAQTLEKMKLAR